MTDHGVSRRTALAGLGGTALIGALSTGLINPAAAATAKAAPTASTARPAKNPKLEARVTALLKRMTLAEKLGQLQLINLPDLAKQSLAGTTPCGGVFSVVGAATLNELQKISVEQTRLGIPLIFGLDVIHGYTTNFPIPLAQASSFDPAVATSDATVSAKEARSSGITWTYAPMMDVTHEPRWGRIAEGDGEDPYLASQMAVAKVRAYQGADYSAPDKVAACAKHYVAYGGTEGGRDYNTVDVSIQELHNHYLPPFKASVEAGVATVMAAFNTVAGVPAHANKYTLRQVLKDSYGFDGFVVSDYTGIQELIMHGVAGDGADAATAGINAGVDMEMVSTNYVDFGRQLLSQGRITTAEIDDAVRRILRVKFELGLFEHPYVDPSREVTAVSPANRAAANHAGSRSMVLLKNDNAVLPLKKAAKLAVVGPLAKATYDLNGTWSGLGTGAGTTPPVTVVDGLTARRRERDLRAGLRHRVHGHLRICRGSGGRSGRRRGGVRRRRERGDERGGIGAQRHRSAGRSAAATRRVGGDRKAGRRGVVQRASVDPAIHPRHGRRDPGGLGARCRGRQCGCGRAVRGGQSRRQAAGVVPAGGGPDPDLLQPPEHRATVGSEQQVHLEVP